VNIIKHPALIKKISIAATLLNIKKKTIQAKKKP